jgi:hypothetical protein
MPDEEEDTRRLTGGDVIDMRQLTEARRRRAGVDTRKKAGGELKPQPEPGVVQKPETKSAEESEPRE